MDTYTIPLTLSEYLPTYLPTYLAIYLLSCLQYLLVNLPTYLSQVGLGNRTEEDFDTDWFHSWTVWSSGGSGWSLDGDAGGDMCFLTSNQSCSKEQVVELGKLAPTWWVIDTFQPAIEVEESYMASPGHGAVYEMTLSLLDADRNVLGQPFTFRDDVGVRPV